jgi:pilus assembly protein Flp/PilA
MLISFEYLASWLRTRYAGGERGASMVEYSLLLALIAVICIAAVGLLGRSASSSFSTTGSAIGNAG